MFRASSLALAPQSEPDRMAWLVAKPIFGKFQISGPGTQRSPAIGPKPNVIGIGWKFRLVEIHLTNDALRRHRQQGRPEDLAVEPKGK